MTTPLNVYVGIFDSDQGQRFLDGLLVLTSVALSELWSASSSHSQYTQCIKHVHKWSSDLMSEQIRMTHERMPDFSMRYYEIVDAFKYNVRAVLSQEEGKRTVTVDEFVSKYMQELASDECIRDGSYFRDKNNLITKHLVCMRSARNALFRLCTSVVHDEEIDPSDSISNC